MNKAADTDMKITIITPENIQDYMDILTSYEFFGRNSLSLSDLAGGQRYCSLVLKGIIVRRDVIGN